MQELYHHGTKGQKWGIRNYQNYDGTLTAEGKKRYTQLNKLNESRVLADYYKSESQRNIDRFSKSNSSIAKLLVKTNSWNIKQCEAKATKSKAKIDAIIKELKDNGVNTYAYYDPALGNIKFKAEGSPSNYGKRYL